MQRVDIKLSMTSGRSWLLYALVTTIFWGVWGAFIEIPEKSGFPPTLGYVIWSLSMIPCAIVALMKVNWSINKDVRSILLGATVGLTGAAGQLLLFQALREGPAYIVFPFISLFPVCTIILAFIFLREHAKSRQWWGIGLALIAIFFLSYQSGQHGHGPGGVSWIFYSVLVFLMWGVQAFVMKFSNDTMTAESIFFYMTLTALLLSPVAIMMTDFSHPVNLGFKGPYLAFIIHILNSIGALTLVYALRYGKAIVVVPMTGLSPIITVVISLILYSVVPSASITLGVVLAIGAIYLLSD
jgi:uncharacterized membrane protein